LLEDIYEETQMMMDESFEALRRDYKTLRTGKVSTTILDGIRVDYYGTPTALSQVATVLTTDATTISISPWEKPMLQEIERAISTANIGVNPNNDGETIKLFFPAMTVEQRGEIAKNAKSMTDHAKVSIRNNRKDGNDDIKKLEKEKEITSDESKSAQEKIQKMTDENVAKIDALFKSKEAEILTV